VALRQIIDGHLDVPVLMMKFYLDYTPQDTEFHFILALAYAQRQQLTWPNSRCKQRWTWGYPPSDLLLGRVD